MSSSELLSMQAPQGVPRSTVFKTVTDPLLPPQRVDEMLAHFPDNVYDKRPESHLSRLLKVLLGESGTGQLRKRYTYAHLSQFLATTHYQDLDTFFSGIFGLKRFIRESIDIDAYRDSALDSEWEAINAADASYRSRLSAFSAALSMAGTPSGLTMAANALLGHEVRIYETYEFLEMGGSLPFESRVQDIEPGLITPSVLNDCTTLTGWQADVDPSVGTTKALDAGTVVITPVVAASLPLAQWLGTYSMGKRYLAVEMDPNPKVVFSFNGEPVSPIVNEVDGWRFYDMSTMPVVSEIRAYFYPPDPWSPLRIHTIAETDTPLPPSIAAVDAAVGARSEFVIRPLRPITTEEKYQLVKVLDRLKPVESILTIDDSFSNTYIPLNVSRVAASSSYWHIRKTVSIDPQRAGFYSHYIDGEPAEQPRLAFSHYQGEAWNYNGEITEVSSYVEDEETGDRTQDVNFDRYVDYLGHTHDYTPDRALTDPTKILAGRHVSDGVISSPIASRGIQ